jgi:YcxB-like protein
MAEREISIATRPTRAQILRLIRRQLLASRPTLFTVVMGFAGPLLLFALHVGFADRSPPPFSVVVIFVAGPAYSLLLLFGVPFGSLRHQTMKDLLEYGVRYRFSDASVFLRGPHGTSDLQWSAFSSALRMGDFYALRLTAGSAFIIPQAAFASGDEERDFVALVREKLGAKAAIR